jgi:DNA-binding beta-propeller fold protein YncE
MIKNLAAACALGFALLATLAAQVQAAPQESKSSKLAPEDIPPIRMIADPYPAFNGVAVDAANGLVAMSDPNRKSLLLYDRAGVSAGVASQGEASVPIRQIVGPDTFLGMIAGIILDPQHREIYTANNDIEDTVVVMPYGASGNVKPARVFSVPHQAWGLALSDIADQLAVTVEVQNTIVFYRRQVKGVEAPVKIIRGQATGLADPHGIYWDESHNEIGVANHGNFRGVVKNTGGGCTPSFAVEDESGVEAGESRPPSIRIFAATARDDAKPLRVIQGPRTGLDWPMGIAYDPQHDTIVVANNGDSSILIFGRNSNGDGAPLRVIRGDRTGISHPMGVSVDPQKDEIWVSNWGDHSALAFDSGAHGNVAPKRIIRSAPAGTATPGFGNPMALAYDSKRDELLVPN